MNLLEFPLDAERLAGLVLELYSQLHAERLHRLALEATLVRAGVLDPAALQEVAGEASLREAGMRAAEESVARLMRVVTERGDARMPLRTPDAGASGGE